MQFQKVTWPKWKSVCYVDSAIYLMAPDRHSSIASIEEIIAQLEAARIIEPRTSFVKDSHRMASFFNYSYSYEVPGKKVYSAPLIAELAKDRKEVGRHFVVLKGYDWRQPLNAQIEYDPLYATGQSPFHEVISLRVFTKLN